MLTVFKNRGVLAIAITSALSPMYLVVYTYELDLQVLIIAVVYIALISLSCAVIDPMPMPLSYAKFSYQKAKTVKKTTCETT